MTEMENKIMARLTGLDADSSHVCAGNLWWAAEFLLRERERDPRKTWPEYNDENPFKPVYI